MQEEGRSALTQGDIKRPLSPPLPPIKPLPCHKMASFTGLGNDRGGETLLCGWLPYTSPPSSIFGGCVVLTHTYILS